jgi:DNA-binding NarL/FixJ family response regulator
MQLLDVILLQCDSGVAKPLVSALGNSFRAIHQVGSMGEVRASIAKHRATIAILDMESATLSDVEVLSREFPAASIVCTHRCADEEMWRAALNAGARDLCASTDTRGILQAALRTASVTRSAAA